MRGRRPAAPRERATSTYPPRIIPDDAEPARQDRTPPAGPGGHRLFAGVPAAAQPAAKGFYKLEPVVADSGEVVLYAPRIRDSSTHKEIYDIGDHCRDYFVKQ